MKAAAYFVGAGVVFLALVAAIVGQNSRLSSISEAQAAVTEQKNVLQYPVEFKFKRPAGRPTDLFAVVTMSHFDHQSVPCTTCHHTWDGKKGKIESCSTKGCHDNFESKTEPNSYFRAFHTASSETSCRGCHLKMTNEGKASLPTSPCASNACHPAKKN